MLSTRVHLAVLALTVGFIVAVTPLSARADDVVCPRLDGACTVVVTTPGTPGTGTGGWSNGGGGAGVCRWAGETVPCSITMPSDAAGHWQQALAVFDDAGAAKATAVRALLAAAR